MFEEGPGALDNAQLRLVQVIFRHGARTPLTPEKPFWEGGCHKGQLTLLGQEQTRALGSWLRQRYMDQMHFLEPQLEHAGVLSARTTHFQRTIATLQGVLTGLYPDAAESGITIPAVTAGDGNEIMSGGTHDLPGGKGHPPFVELLDCHHLSQSHSKATPCDYDDHLATAIEAEAVKRMAWAVAPEGDQGKEVLKLGLGHLVNEVVVMPLLRMLQQRFSTWPGYAANIVLELWQGKEEQWVVRALYNGRIMDCHQNSGKGIPLEQFLDQFLLPYQLPMEDHDAYCSVRDPDAEPSNTAQAASGSSVQGI
ncbi:hypothetical protein WJX73_002754 [Symbiochloris irregularis]|uniref:Acid phosphatase n=1 Tax=Symbiochloris irregularis TaxID=706552 RepID=A0AAW1P8G1_9CHLO